jgi:hypothetical protein
MLDHLPLSMIGDSSGRDKRSYHRHVHIPPKSTVLIVAIVHRVIVASKKKLRFDQISGNQTTFLTSLSTSESYSILSAVLRAVCSASAVRKMKEVVMRKFLILALFSMVFAAAACTKSEETPAPEASAAASPDAGAASAEASPAASEAASPAASDAGSPMASPAAS